ncbi:MAG: PDZ domain-containing protein [Asticcacaulis sp.]
MGRLNTGAVCGLALSLLLAVGVALPVLSKAIPGSDDDNSLSLLKKTNSVKVCNNQDCLTLEQSKAQVMVEAVSGTNIRHLRKGDRIISVNQRPVLEPQDVFDIARQSSDPELTLVVLRGTQTLTLTEKNDAPFRVSMPPFPKVPPAPSL